MRAWLSRCAAVVIAMVLVGVGTQPASAGDGKPGSGGHQQGGQYLALGDSIPFGFNPLVSPVASNYIGYPELAAAELGLTLTNASCPGQTSSGFISLTGTDNNCFGFRQIPGAMHTAYDTSQLDFAVSFLRSHRDTRLVTVTLGGNDLILCADSSSDQCASQLPQVLKEYAKNLTKILRAIRKVYDGKIVAVNYYSPDYRDLVTTGSLDALNAVESRVVDRFHGTVADAFSAFGAVAAGFGKDTCATGLLIQLPTGGCDVHPSTAGAQLLADTLNAVVACDRGYGRSREDTLVEASG